ncbi:hypothetical protein GQ54DRAFT_297268 [Martensiomyces pterosporus]|nr:hypothetical protein GQ54DRAFT_297268 [Martensiomyces pterosporus]
MAISLAEDFARASSLQTPLLDADCQEMYRKSPALLEIREFVVKHALSSSNTPNQDAEREKSPRQHAARALPVASLRDIINSLFEENRYEEGTRFLSTIGEKELVRDAKLVRSLLAIFKPTNLIEEDLERRSSFLLQSTRNSNVDFSGVWRVDNSRRRAIAQAQQSALMHLESARVQFVRPWFMDEYKDAPGEFWDYLQELTVLPQKYDDAATDRLELELYHNRMKAACVLLEQICADLAANVADMSRSVFLKIVSEGYVTDGRISNLTKTLDVVFARFGAISCSRSPVAESKCAALLLDMLAAASACDAVSRERCVQGIAKHLWDQNSESRIEFIDLICSDTLAVEIIDYTLVSWYRFASRPAKWHGQTVKQAVTLQPGVLKTAFCLQYARPRSKKETLSDWYDLVCLLTKLAQRSMSAYVSRMCHANALLDIESASAAGKHPSPVLVTSTWTDSLLLSNACKELRGHIEKKRLPPATRGRQSAAPWAGSLSSSSDEMPGSDGEYSDRELGRMMHTELDLLESFLADS